MSRQGQTRRRSCPPRGFSLAEVVTVIVIIGTLSAIAIPRLNDSIALQRVEAAARRIVADLAFAQRHARNSNAAQPVQFDPLTGSYSLIGMPDPDRPSVEYKVTLAEEPYGVRMVSAKFGTGTRTTFDVFGIPNNGGTVVVAAGSHTRTIVVDLGTGKATSQ